MNIRYIPATHNDRAFFVDVHHTAYRDSIKKMFGWDEVLQDGFANAAFDEGGIHIILYENQRIGVVGWENREDCFWLKEFFILPDFQRQGIGSRIIKETIARAKAEQKDVHLRTLRNNIEAKQFYESHGFEVTDSTDIHWNMVLRV